MACITLYNCEDRKHKRRSLNDNLHRNKVLGFTGCDTMQWFGTQSFGGPCCPLFTLKMEAARSSEALLSYHTSTQRQNPKERDLNFYNRRASNYITTGVHVLRFFKIST